MKYGEPVKAPDELVYGKAIEPSKVIEKPIPIPATLFNFSWALEYLKDDAKVTRAAWEDDQVYVSLNSVEQTLYINFGERWIHKYMPRLDDLLAEDWKFIQEKTNNG